MVYLEENALKMKDFQYYPNLEKYLSSLKGKKGK